MNIYQKIAEVMKDIQYLCKDDHVKFGQQNYKAISEEKVTSTVRESLIKNGIVIIPIKQDHRRDGTISTVDVSYKLQNIDDTDDFVIAVSSGTGADTQDKGVGKAMTYSYKYLLLRTFAIPTGEDPDKVSSAEIDSKQKPPAKPPILVGKNHIAAVAAELTRTGWNVGDMLEYLGKKFNCKINVIEEMTIPQFKFIMGALKGKPDKHGC